LNNSGLDVVAAIDIGTNSFHLVVARVTGPTAFEVLAREKDMVRLGAGEGQLKHIGPEALERGIETLSRFRKLADVHEARIAAVATSAVREADNGSEFLKRARDEAGIEVQVISGFEEARLIHLGVLQAVPVFDQRMFLCDVGGGSTELLIGSKGETLAVRSMKLGSIRLTEKFFDAKRVSPAAVELCRSHIRSNLAPFGRGVQRLGFDIAVGSSGTMGALCAIAAARRSEPAPRTFNNFLLSKQELSAVVKSLIKAPTVAARAKLPGIDPSRADIILPGALIIEQVFEEFGIEEMTFSDYALREGVLLDAWQRRHGGSLHHLSDLRRRSVVHLAEVMDEDRSHSNHLARLALDMFDQTAQVHELGDEAREYLEAAALLCNIGLFLSHAGHHLHSYYMIRNSEHLTGFTDREIELIAQIARYHRRGAPRSKHPEFAVLSKEDQNLVRVCAGLLRVAIGLDRNHGSRVAGVVVTANSKELTIEADPRTDADIGLELFSAAQRSDLLAEALGLEVNVVQRTLVALGNP
jgi:exopolyphosphatase / guanosine-5'-triphosphate,3'-diphosphate pyrophosphatase